MIFGIGVCQLHIVLKEIYPLKKKYKFTLIGSGGINSANDLAIAFALGF